jgi:hypothetical protein
MIPDEDSRSKTVQPERVDARACIRTHVQKDGLGLVRLKPLLEHILVCAISRPSDSRIHCINYGLETSRGIHETLLDCSVDARPPRMQWDKVQLDAERHAEFVLPFLPAQGA